MCFKILARKFRQCSVIAVNERFAFGPSPTLYLFLPLLGFSNTGKLGCIYKLDWASSRCVLAAKALVVFPDTTFQVVG